MIDQFTKQDFEDYLQSNHSPFQSLGLIDGEETYLLPLDNQVSITIRSSIKSNGLSADVGKDSIRCWLVNGDKPLGSKVSRWTARQAGWQDGLYNNIKQLVLWRSLAGDCKECDKPKGIFKARTQANKGRPFARCKDHKDSFVWLDEPIKTKDIYFSEESMNDTDKITITQERGVALNRRQDNDTLQHRDIQELPRNILSELQQENLPQLPKNPNSAQRSAIEAEVNANLRVLASPGSGKTFVIEHRYAYLVENGIDPQNILVCTFSKAMADEMGKRIQATCPEAILDQISTIHAFCYRVLCRWYSDSRYYKWQMPKDWQVKKQLEETIGIIWQEKEKPNVPEVLNYVNTSKYLSLTADDSYNWFIQQLGRQYGEWLYEIRCKFDAWLTRNRFLTFNDMLYLVEKQLQNDSNFRTMLQERFSHVVIDEAQDTNYQAMRILVTISLEPGMNTVYESETR